MGLARLGRPGPLRCGARRLRSRRAGAARARGRTAHRVESLHGTTGACRRSSLTQGQGTTVPLTVTSVPGEVSLSVAVRFGRRPAAELRGRHRVVAERRGHARGAGGRSEGHRPGAAPGHRVLGHHRRARAQRPVVRAGTAAGTPSSSARPTSGPSAWGASTGCSARTSSSTSAGWSSTTAGGSWCWVDGRSTGFTWGSLAGRCSSRPELTVGIRRTTFQHTSRNRATVNQVELAERR